MLQSRDFGLTVTVPSRRPVVIREPLSLPRAVLTWFDERGLFPDGVRIVTRADVPPGSGFGSSSAMTIALVSAIASHVSLPLTPQMAAEIACEIEIDLLDRPIGRQDQYASALGGLNTIAFSPDGVVVTPLSLTPRAPTGAPGSPPPDFDAPDPRLGQGVTGAACRVGQRRRSHAPPASHQGAGSSHGGGALAGDLPGFGMLLHDSWQLKRGLAKGVSSTEIDRWYQIAQERGAYGGKIAGAGGGGFFLFCVPRIAART